MEEILLHYSDDNCHIYDHSLQYTYTRGVLELDVSVSVRWNENFYIDSPTNVNGKI